MTLPLVEVLHAALDGILQSEAESITFYRANTDIELDYWDGDTATLLNADGNLIDSMTYPGEDSWWDKVYTIAENGSLWKQDPSPSERQGTCFTESDNTVESYILKGRIVTMTGQGVIDNGNLMIEGVKLLQFGQMAKFLRSTQITSRLRY